MTRTAKRKRAWKDIFGFNRGARKSATNSLSRGRFSRQMAIDPLEERRLLTLQFNLTPIGDLSGGLHESVALGINELGHLAGSSVNGIQMFTNAPTTGAVTYAYPGPITNIGEFTSADIGAYGRDINNAGYVVGKGIGSLSLGSESQGIYTGGRFNETALASLIQVPGDGDRALLWNPNTQTWTDLGDLPGGITAAEAYAINNNNLVVGTSIDGNGPHAFYRAEGGSMTAITHGPGFLGTGRSIAYGVNDAGIIVGMAETSTNNYSPFYYDTTAVSPTMVKINGGTVDSGTTFSRILSINENGFAVGQAKYTDSGNTVLIPVGWQLQDGEGEFIVNPDPVPLLDLLPDPGPPAIAGIGIANSINIFGSVVGSATFQSGVEHATIWSLQRDTVDLNDVVDSSGAGWTIIEAFEINNSGQIAAVAKNGSDQLEGVLLTPYNTAPTLTPIAPDNFTVTEGVPFTLTITATDPDVPDNLTYSLTPGAPAGMVLSKINNNTAVLTWTPSASDPNSLAIGIRVTDDGHQFLSDSQSIFFGIERPLIFEEDFEGGATPGVWDFTNPGEGQAVVVNTLSVPGGSEALLLDSAGVDIVKDSAEAILTLDLSAQTDAMLVFHQLEGSFGTANDDEDDILPDVHTGVGLGDGVSISNDGITWYALKDGRDANINRVGDGLWMLHEFDLGANIERINTEQGSTVVSFSSTFKIKWSQYDDAAFPLDGWAIDNIKVYDDAQFFDPSLPSDVFHRVDSYDPNLFFRVASFGNVDADTPILVSVHGTLREVTRMTTYWQQYVEDPSNGVNDLIVVAPFFPEDSPYVNYGDLSWDNFDSLNADEALLDFITQMTATGVGDGSELYMFGFSQGAGFAERFTMAHPDRVASAVIAGSDNHIYPVDEITFDSVNYPALFPYGIADNPARPVPDGVTLDPQAFLEHPIMYWVGQNDEFVTDVSFSAQLQGLLRIHRTANMFEQVHDTAEDLALSPANYNYELFIQEGRGHLYDQTDMGTFYDFLFANFDPTTPIEVSPRVVLTPTVGETQVTLPAEDVLIPETSDFWVEIWATSPNANGILDGSVTLAYDTSIMDAVEIQYSSLFSTATTGTIDDANGRVRDIGGSTAISGLGVGEHVLLARVRFTPETVGSQFKIPVFAGLQEGTNAFTLAVSGDIRTDLLPFSRFDIDSVNAPPVLAAIPPQVVDEGDPLAFLASATDAEMHSLTFSLGPGAPVGASIHPFTGVFTWTADNSMGASFQLEVIVTDNGTPSKSDSQLVDVTVNLAAAVANIGGPYSGNEGTLIALSGAGSSGATLYEWDLDNDGQYDDATGVSPNFNALDNGVYTIGLRVNGPGGSTDSTTVTVNNVAPTASISGTTAIYRGETVTFTLNASDASPVDQAGLFTFEIDWDGNGTVDQTVAGVPSGTTVMHTFPGLTTNNIQVRATDKDASTGAFGQTPITVTPHVLRGDGFGNTDLIWGGTPLFDSVYVVGQAPSLVLLVEIEGLIPVNRVEFFGSAVTGRVIIYGYDFTDVLIGQAAVGNVVEIHGGAGNDVIVGGFQGDFLYGGPGDDLILGGTGVLDGADTIFGDEGRDTIFGHLGADTINGGAGEDLIISDRYNFTNIPTAVQKIHEEWKSARPYSERVSNLLGTTSTGVNGPWKLQPGVTVLDDGAADSVTGGIGDLDWFFYDFDQDILGDTIEIGEEETDSDP